MYRPTIVTNVPTMLGKLLEHDDVLAKEGKPGLDLSSIRFSLSAGEALPEPLLRRWLDRFASDVYDGIGSAEMFHIYASNRPGDIKPGSLGKVVAGYELRILPEEAEGPGATPCAPGEIGVLWVKGDSVSQGYWLDRDKSWRTFHGHWCRTGDLFRIDEEGYLYFAGRADDLLKVGGQWVAPLEVEECLLAHAAVAAAAVIGVEDEGLVKTKAFIVVRAGHAGTRRARDRAPGAREGARSRAQVPARDRVRRRPAEERSRQGRQESAPRARARRSGRVMARHVLRGARPTKSVSAIVSGGPSVAIVPVGSVEPHGPHLPLHTDTTISETCAARAAAALEGAGVRAVVAPSVPYGVTEYAARVLGRDRRARRPRSRRCCARSPSASSSAAFSHVCFVNNHLEPAHDAAVRAAIDGLPEGAASVACPLTRRWGRTLSDEFKRGDCHAGRYETSLVLAAGERVRGTLGNLPKVGAQPQRRDQGGQGYVRRDRDGPRLHRRSRRGDERGGRRALRAPRHHGRDRGHRGPREARPGMRALAPTLRSTFQKHRAHAPAVRRAPAHERAVDGDASAALEEADEAERNRKQVILEAFARLLSGPVHEEAVR